MKITKLIFCFLISSLVFSKTSQIDTSPIQITQPTDKEEILNIYYQNNALIVQGMKINGRLIVYSIIGNVLLEMNVQDFSNLVLPVDLIKQNMYIIRLETSDNRVFTHKIVAR